MNRNSALLVVDVQNDFCPGGALGVNNGHLVIPPLNKIIDLCEKKNLHKYFSADRHPHRTEHFKEFGGLWPVHCVRTTWGARLHPQLYFPLESIHETTHMIYKGEGSKDDGYSVFEGNIYLESPYGTTMHTPKEMLKKQGIQTLYIGGLATDYCVKATCLDARNLEFETYLLKDACRAVNINDPNAPWKSEPKIIDIIYYLRNNSIPATDENIALRQMKQAGVKFTTTDEVLRESR